MVGKSLPLYKRNKCVFAFYYFHLFVQCFGFSESSVSFAFYLSLGRREAIYLCMLFVLALV